MPGFFERICVRSGVENPAPPRRKSILGFRILSGLDNTNLGQRWVWEETYGFRRTNSALSECAREMEKKSSLHQMFD
ncbi:hypothetical protein QJS10_CPA05g00648 [Acorus calamus]|uniref:Uncharacterized protein n=1 Tax=Acorus calamus TaxID=4465 RepID=A0AAV9ESE3_ACOCL|nr:hypothetical protein QJS10_CPA05g00648 [Acorus calamus]